MRNLGMLFALCTVAVGPQVSAQVRTESDQWILNQEQDLFPVPQTRQPDVHAGTMIELLPTGLVTFYTPPAVIAPVDKNFTVGTSETIKALQVGLIAKFVGIGLSGKLQNTADIKIQQTDFKGLGYDDKTREDMILQKGTSVVNEYEKVQDEYAKQKRNVPIYFVQAVYTTADLEVEGARNLILGASGNADLPDGCKAVTPPADAASPEKKGSQAAQGGDAPAADPDKKAQGNAGGGDKPKGAGAQKGTGNDAGGVADKGAAKGAGAVDAGPGAGVQFCKGSGGKDSLKGTTQVPVAMKVCYIFYAPSDQSWNCGKARRDLTFK